MYYYTYGGMYNAPPFVNNQPNASMNYWQRSLLQRLTALIDFDNLPQAGPDQYGWDKDALKYGLFMRGFQVVFQSKTYGVVPQPGTLTGYSLQFQPSGVMVATPYFQFTQPLQIGVNCELLKLTPDYTTLFDIVAKYAGELKEIDTSIRSSARNSRLAYALVAAGDRGARTLQAVREKIINGDDVIVDEKIMRDKVNPDTPPWFQFDRDLKANYILNDLLDARRKTLVDFYREIGVRMIDDKKERLLTAEVYAGNAETFIRSEVWIETLKESCEKINRMFGLDIVPRLNKPDLEPVIMDSGKDNGEEVENIDVSK